MPAKAPAKFSFKNVTPFLPPSASLFDDSLNSRIRVFVGPRRKSTSERYDTKDVHECLVSLLKWAWKAHNDLTHEPIPDMFAT